MAEGDRWLVVGLGNPEAEHGGTRHNVGADLVRRLADRHGASLSANKRVRCDVVQVRLPDARATLAVPHGYMNNAGGPVQQLVSWFDVPPGRLIVAHDDLDLELGILRLKAGGGHGGHNGLRDVHRALDSGEHPRVRIGIGRPPGRMSPRDHVLGRFRPAEREVVDGTLEDAADAVELLVARGLEPAQNVHH